MIHMFLLSLRHPAWGINLQQYFNVCSHVPCSFFLATVKTTAPDFVLDVVWVQMKMPDG